MPTTVVKTIGQTSSPTVPDYTTLAAWMAACPANLVTADQVWEGQCLDQGTFTASVTISGITTDATRFVRLTCAAGASFSTKAGVRTTALTYNTANGVTIAVSGSSAITISSNYTELIGVQARRTDYNNALSISNGTTNVLVDTCIFSDGDRDTSIVTVGTGNQSTNRVVNCLVVCAFKTPGMGGQASVYGCTVVCTAAGNTQVAFTSSYNNMLVKDSAGFGFNAFVNGGASTRAGSDYNATDNASASTGTHNLTSLTFASQFVSSTNDFRAAGGGSLPNSGIADANLPDDISLFTRSSPPTIGCWEFSSGAVAGGKTSLFALGLRRGFRYRA